MGKDERVSTMSDDFYLPLHKEAQFPNLRRGEYRVTSIETSNYNCIAHAASKCDNWWWPVGSGSYWPGGVPEETLDAFIAAYGTEGFAVCQAQSRDPEPGVERVAIYVDDDGTPTHAARQLPDGTWTSKLGGWEDIMHVSLEAMEDKDDLGLGYGKVALILKRSVPA